ncbi:TPA: hypothetical protein ACJEWJ_005535 [Klebsiella quasipneumoniae]
MEVTNNNPQNFRAEVDGHEIHINKITGVTTTHPKKAELEKYYTNGVKSGANDNLNAIKDILNPPAPKKPRKKSSN